MTIKDIAIAAQVSVSTVSKVLNQKDEDISDATRQRVLRIIREFQYTPYSSIKAQAMNMPANTLGLFILHPAYCTPVFLDTLGRYAAQNGYSILLHTLCGCSEDVLTQRVKTALSKNVAGLLICTHDPLVLQHIVSLVSRQVPVVAVTCFHFPDCTTIRCDYAAAASDAISALSMQGHSRIGFILDETEPEIHRQIYSGVLSGMNLQSIPFPQQGLINIQNDTLLQTDLQELLAHNLTAIYCQTISLAEQAHSILNKSGYLVPHDISLVCGMCSRRGVFSLHAYEIPFESLAEQATKALIDRINERSVLMQDITLPLPCVRGTSICAPSGSEAPFLVLGDCASDTILSVSRIPSRLQQIRSSKITTAVGGKCVSMSIALSRLGCCAYAIGRVGNDAEGRALLNTLADKGVRTDGILIDDTAFTGRSYLTVEENSGDYTVVTYSGANGLLDIQSITNVFYLFPTTAACLIATEIPLRAIKSLIQKCVPYSIPIFLKPSQPIPVDPVVMAHIDYFVPNEIELGQMFPGPRSLEEKAADCYRLGCKNVIVTLANNGCYLCNAQYRLHIPAANFTAVETASAANCFIGALAYSLSQKSDLLYAISYASYAAGISISQHGMWPSFPFKDQMDSYAEEINDFYLDLLEKANTAAD